MNTESYSQFADGPYLTRKAMEWFWDAYPTDQGASAQITASPNQATVEQLKGLPPTLLLVDEADPLRDEGEAYAPKLRLAGVPVTTVRYDGTCHDFMLLNSLSNSRATRAAIAQATSFLRDAFRAPRAHPDREPSATHPPLTAGRLISLAGPVQAGTAREVPKGPSDGNDQCRTGS